MRRFDLRWTAAAAAGALALTVGLPAGGAAQTVAGPAGAPESVPLQEAGPGGPAADSVKATVYAFHDALAAGDSTAALALLHPEVRVYEGGHAESLSEYRAGHLAADMEFSAATERDVLSEHVFGGDDQAVYLSEYRMAGSFRGERVETHGTETMVLARTDEGWRIRHIHWSSR